MKTYKITITGDDYREKIVNLSDDEYRFLKDIFVDGKENWNCEGKYVSSVMIEPFNPDTEEDDEYNDAYVDKSV